MIDLLNLKENSSNDDIYKNDQTWVMDLGDLPE